MSLIAFSDPTAVDEFTLIRNLYPQIVPLEDGFAAIWWADRQFLMRLFDDAGTALGEQRVIFDPDTENLNAIGRPQAIAMGDGKIGIAFEATPLAPVGPPLPQVHVRIVDPAAEQGNDLSPVRQVSFAAEGIHGNSGLGATANASGAMVLAWRQDHTYEVVEFDDEGGEPSVFEQTDPIPYFAVVDTSGTPAGVVGFENDAQEFRDYGPVFGAMTDAGGDIFLLFNHHVADLTPEATVAVPEAVLTLATSGAGTEVFRATTPFPPVALENGGYVASAAWNTRDGTFYRGLYREGQSELDWISAQPRGDASFDMPLGVAATHDGGYAALVRHVTVEGGTTTSVTYLRRFDDDGDQIGADRPLTGGDLGDWRPTGIASQDNGRVVVIGFDEVPSDNLLVQTWRAPLWGSDRRDLMTDDDRLNDMVGNGGNDRMVGLGGPDLMEGNGGNDEMFGNSGADTMFGGAGSDTIEGRGGSDALDGGKGDDLLRGGSRRDILEGGDDEDTLFGGAGDDNLVGDAGNDTLFGDAGKDVLAGGAGEDSLDGGRGDDILFGFEVFLDSDDDGGDALAGGGGNDELFGGSGSDIVDGGAGNDTVRGGDDGDLMLRGNAGDDEIYGGDGDDFIQGDFRRKTGDDTLKGGAGDDTLDGGLGIDDMTGGPGNDVFVFGTRGFDDASIRDFTPRSASGSERDRIVIAPSAGEAEDFDEFIAASIEAEGLVVYDLFNDGLGVITLQDVALDDLRPGDFLFEEVDLI